MIKWQKYSDEATSRHILAVNDIKEKFEAKESWYKKSEEGLQNKIKVLKKFVIKHLRV